jgi:hypothetical protein
LHEPDVIAQVTTGPAGKLERGLRHQVFDHSIHGILARQVTQPDSDRFGESTGSALNRNNRGIAQAFSF